MSNNKFKNFFNHIFTPGLFLWLVPLVLVVPNIVLDCTEQYSELSRVSNLLLPWGIYLLLMCAWKNLGRTSLLLFPVMFYGAFQIVLIFLYGGSIIAVDMFLNLVTTNVSEATELLGSLLPAIIIVVVLYVPILVWGIVLCCKKRKTSVGIRKAGAIAGVTAVVIGAVCLGFCYRNDNGYNAIKDIFPANVVNNTFIAADRVQDTEDYFNTSAAFTYNASSERPDSIKEVYVMIVGETSRAGNWQLFGYERPTNPRLSRRDDVLAYPRTLSESNTTHKSVPLMLSWLSADNFGDSIYTTKSVVTAFKEAGYRTAFLSNQARNHSFIEFFAEEADETVFLPDSSGIHYDSVLVPMLKDYIKDNGDADKLFIVLHTYGSHFNYADRYDHQHTVFTPCDNTLAEAENREQLLNSYDNTIVATDALLDDVMSTLDSLGCYAGVLYASDHGEDIFDDSRERFLHASPVPTYYQIHVPLVMWLSPELRSAYPDLYDNAAAHTQENVSSSSTIFDTLLQMAGISTPYATSSKALTSADYKSIPRRYVTDHNEGHSLYEVGLRTLDFEKFKEKGISVD